MQNSIPQRSLFLQHQFSDRIISSSSVHTSLLSPEEPKLLSETWSDSASEECPSLLSPVRIFKNQVFFMTVRRMTDSPWLFLSPSRSQGSPAEYPQKESGNPQHSVFFITSIIQGFIFPSQNVAMQDSRCRQQYLASMHHVQNVIAYACITRITFSFILRASLQNALHTS